MLKIGYHELNSVSNNELKFAVIMARHDDKWIFVKHRERETWEIPGGHREPNEDINITASRELIEETGAEDFSITPVCIYSVNTGEGQSFGQLFYSEVHKLKGTSDFEIEEVKLFETIPEKLTYPQIQPHLFQRVEEYSRNK